MANVEQLVHLEHLEDEMLNRGVEGCKKTVGDLKEVREKQKSLALKKFIKHVFTRKDKK